MKKINRIISLCIVFIYLFTSNEYIALAQNKIEILDVNQVDNSYSNIIQNDNVIIQEGKVDEAISDLVEDIYEWSCVKI